MPHLRTYVSAGPANGSRKRSWVLLTFVVKLSRALPVSLSASIYSSFLSTSSKLYIIRLQTKHGVKLISLSLNMAQWSSYAYNLLASPSTKRTPVSHGFSVYNLALIFLPILAFIIGRSSVATLQACSVFDSIADPKRMWCCLRDNEL